MTSFYHSDFRRFTGATTENLPPGVLYRVVATYKYDAEDTDELSFEKGEIISVVPYDDPETQVGRDFRLITKHVKRVSVLKLCGINRVINEFRFIQFRFQTGGRLVDWSKRKHRRKENVPRQLYQALVRCAGSS